MGSSRSHKDHVPYPKQGRLTADLQLNFTRSPDQARTIRLITGALEDFDKPSSVPKPSPPADSPDGASVHSTPSHASQVGIQHAWMENCWVDPGFYDTLLAWNLRYNTENSAPWKH